MTQRLYLFADTNLFIQCRHLEELDWSLWPEFSEVHVIVSRPVQREIDNQKNRGNDRVGRRARKAYQLFRDIVTGEDGYAVVRESGPAVKLILQGPKKPASGLSGVLDYSKADDEIVGHLYEHREQHVEHDVRLLTHDSGQMMTAKSLELPFVVIPDSWLLEPEASDTEKENRRLRIRNAELQKGPAFKIAFVDGDLEGVEAISAEHEVYAPLSRDELAELMQRLVESYRLTITHGLGVSAEAYQEWVDACEGILTALHYEMQVESGGVPFTIVAANDGTRSARDALVEISAQGNLSIRPNGEDNAGFYAIMQEQKMSLPPAPRLLQGFDHEGILSIPSARDSSYRRDPNAFYFKPERPEGPVASYSLESEQWRHGTGDSYFDGEIFVLHGDGEGRGLLQCVIHADNLAEPVKADVPVRITVNAASVMERASALVTNFTQGR